MAGSEAGHGEVGIGCCVNPIQHDRLALLVGVFTFGFDPCRQALIGAGKAKQRSLAFRMFDIRCRDANLFRMCAIAFRAFRTILVQPLMLPLAQPGARLPP